MPTERIDIIITERGTRQVKRSIDQVATSADRADREIDEFRRALQAVRPTSELNQALQQIQAIRRSLSGPRTRSAWLNTPINEANTALAQVMQNLRAARTQASTPFTWQATQEFREAERELDDVIRKLQVANSMQSRFAQRNNLTDQTTGAPFLPPTVAPLSDLDRYAREAERAARGADDLSRASDRLNSSARGANRGVMLLGGSIGFLGAGVVAMELMRLADSATVVENRVNIVSDTTDQAAASIQELYDIARRTRTPIEELAQLFQKGMMASTELGVDQREVLHFVEAIGMALAVQGSSAQTARGALIQLSQAIGTDIVRAEEFNSILEGAYPIALAAARGIDRAGNSVARLRRMVIEGEVSSEEFFNAIMSQYPMIAEMFAQTEPTISQSITVFRNKLTEYISTSEEAQAISNAIADSIILIADNIEPLADLLFGLGVAWAAGFTFTAVGRVAAMAASSGLLVGALKAIAPLVGAGGPVGTGIAIVAGAAFLAYKNLETSADRIDRLRESMNDGVSALQDYNEAVQNARKEQEELGGVVNLTTESILRQSRATLQESLRQMQQDIQAIEDDLAGVGVFDRDNIRAMANDLATGNATVGQVPPGGDRRDSLIFDNAEIENLYNMLRAVETGTGTLDGFLEALNRIRGAGPEISAAVSDLQIALDALPDDLTQEPTEQASLWLEQATEQLTSIADMIGGFEAEINAVANAQALPEKIEALDALRQGLEAAEFAGNVVRNSSWITETADLLQALEDAKELEQTMMEALGANAQRLQELTDQAEQFATPMGGAADAAIDTEATLQDISFAPLEQGARGFADQLTRAATAAHAISNMKPPEIPSNTNGPIMASYSNPTRDAVGGQGLMQLNSGGSFEVGGNAGVDQNLVAFWASKGEQVTVTPRGSNLMGSANRTNQSEEYLDTIRTINQELEERYNQLTQNNQMLEEERILQDALQTANKNGVVLGQQDVALIRERAQAIQQLETRLKFIKDINDAVFNNMETALNNFVQTGTFNFSQFARSVIEDLAAIGIQMMVIAPLKNFMGGALNNLMPNLPLPEYNEGADFMVGGRGGVDQNVVAFRASRGERVQVTPAGEDSKSRGNTVIFNISTPDVEGFRRSESQMAARAQRMLAHGRRNT